MEASEKRNEQGQTLKEFLEAYNPKEFLHPSVTADVVVFTLVKSESKYSLATVLIRRKNHPSIGELAFPGGFVEYDEDTKNAATRELFEETGIENLPNKPFAVFGRPNRDPRTRVITIANIAIAPIFSLKPKAGDDAAASFICPLSVSRKDNTLHIEITSDTALEQFDAHITENVFGDIEITSVTDRPITVDHTDMLVLALAELAKIPTERLHALFGTSSYDENASDCIASLKQCF